MSETIPDDAGGAVVPHAAPPNPAKIMQAKIDAVASLTTAAYAKASELRLTKEESDELLKDFPDDAFRTGAAGKENLIYIEHANLRDRFNQVFGLGQWSLIPVRHWEDEFSYQSKGQTVSGVKVYCEAIMMIRGCFVGAAIGDMDYFPHNNSTNYGDAFEGAKTAAFRRCAKEFGVGLQAWRKSWCEGWFQRQRNGGNSQPAPRPQQQPQQQPQPQQQQPDTELVNMIEAGYRQCRDKVEFRMFTQTTVTPNKAKITNEGAYYLRKVCESILRNLPEHAPPTQPAAQSSVSEADDSGPVVNDHADSGIPF